MAAIGMPPHILALFQARKPLDPFPAFKSKHPRPYVGLADYIKKFEAGPPPQATPFETPKQRRLRRKRQKLLAHLQKQKKLVEEYTPLEDHKIEGDPFATLFVGKLSYETTEKKLKREFEVYGPIRRVRVVRDSEGKHRGYAFIEYERDRDMKEAYKKADGTKVDGRRVLVDVERARTVPGWLPRRLGGGRGPPRGAGKNQPDLSTLVAHINGPPAGETKERGRGERPRGEADRERDRERDRRHQMIETETAGGNVQFQQSQRNGNSSSSDNSSSSSNNSSKNSNNSSNINNSSKSCSCSTSNSCISRSTS
ncbi:hypothetical protein Esti_000965 [Eimeria stiedai]